MTTKKVEKEDAASQLNPLVIYNQINSHLPSLKPSKSNPLVRAYEANNKRNPSESSHSSHEAKKSSRTYEANAPGIESHIEFICVKIVDTILADIKLINV